VEEEFAIALGAEDGRIDDFNFGASQGDDGFADLGNGAKLGRLTAHDSAFANQSAADFKLWLDEENEFAARLSFVGKRGTQGRGQHLGRGDEGDIHGDEFDRLGHLLQFEITRVGFLQQTDARVGAKTRIDLTVSGIDGENAGGSVLQHAVGKTAGRGSNIHANGALERDAPVGERGLEFEASAADITQVIAEQANDAIVGDRVARLLNFLLIDKDASGENHGLRALARWYETTFDKKNVNSLFQYSPSHLLQKKGRAPGIVQRGRKPINAMLWAAMNDHFLCNFHNCVENRPTPSNDDCKGFAGKAAGERVVPLLFRVAPT
jgi:hypothetical protein